MTMPIFKMGIGYYFNNTMTGDGNFHEVKDLTSYYTESGAPAGRWYGSGLIGLGFNGGDVVTKRHARKLFDELRDPLGTRSGAGPWWSRPPRRTPKRPRAGKPSPRARAWPGST